MQRILDCTVSIGRSIHAKVLAVHAYFPEFSVAAASASYCVANGIAPRCVYLESGVPPAYLPEAAEQHSIDVMVMGAISRCHIESALIGSTAERLLESLPCDVLVVKDTKFARC